MDAALSLPRPLTEPHWSRERVLAFSEARREPAWMRDFRARAWACYERLPWPAPTDEAWRRTRLTGLQLEDFALSAPSGAPAAADALPRALRAEADEMESEATLLFQDGNALYAEGLRALQAQGVIFQALSDAVREHPDLVQEYFMTRAVPVDSTVFTALHAALWDSGTFVYVPPHKEVVLPLQVIAHQSAGGAGFHHTLIVAGENAQVTVVDNLLGAARGLQCSVAEIVQGAHSRLRYMNLQDLDLSAWNFMSGRAELQRDADLRWIQVSWGSRLTKAFLDLDLRAAGGHAELLGIYFPTARQHIDHQTLQHHRAPHCRSDLLFNGALKDRARSVYMGSIRVDAGAQQTDAFQRNGNLLLDPDTRADSIPGLEIQANDVRCTHAATAAQVEEEYVFYLMARGLSRPQAERMIVQGFFQAVLERVPVESVVRKLERVIERKIGG